MSKEPFIIMEFEGEEIGTINFEKYLKIPQNRNKTIKEVVEEINQQGYEIKIKFRKTSA